MAPGLEMEYAAIIIDSTTRIGIMMLETRSIPFLTPA